MSLTERRVLTHEAWTEEAIRLFGENGRDWTFRCPGCGQAQSGQDFIDAGQTVEVARSRAYFSCIGRLVPTRGCDWTLGGLFQFHQTEVEMDGKTYPVMEFATDENAPGPDFRPIGKVHL